MDEEKKQTPEDIEAIEENTVDLTDSEPLPEDKVVTPPVKKSRKKRALLLVLLLILAGVLGYYFITQADSEEPADTAATSSEEPLKDQTSQVVEAPNELDQLVYAHADNDSSPRISYKRPAFGGDRTELGFNIEPNSYVASTDGDQYAYVSGNSLFYGEGESLPTSIYELTSGNQFVSVIVDGGSNTIAVSFASQAGSGNSQLKKVISIGVDGSNETTLFEQTGGEFGGVYLTDWNGDSGQLLGKLSCIQCDGFDSNVYVFDENGEGKELIDGGDFNNEISSVIANSDSTQLLYLQGTSYTSADIANLNIQAGLGQPAGPPYELHRVDVESGEDTLLATFGEKKDIEGKFQVPARVGWTTIESGESPVYTYQNKLFVSSNSGTFDTFFETGQGDITAIHAVTDNEVLVSSRPDTESGDSVVTYFNLEKNQAETVLQATFNTLILGYTLK